MSKCCLESGKWICKCFLSENAENKREEIAMDTEEHVPMEKDQHLDKVKNSKYIGSYKSCHLILTFMKLVIKRVSGEL